ncbi:dihydrofolate reductase family protein [Rhodocaloribacter sp.]
MQTTVFIATSLDGFIARRDGSLDWLTEGLEADGDEDYGYRAFFDTVDALVMGRRTFETALGFDAWPYGEKPVVVLTRREGTIPAALARTVTSMPPAPGEVVRRLAARGFRHLYIDGGQTIRGFLREGLIRRLILTRVPILLGEGIPLFGALPEALRLHHVATRTFPSGLVQSTYEMHATGTSP